MSLPLDLYNTEFFGQFSDFYGREQANHVLTDDEFDKITDSNNLLEKSKNNQYIFPDYRTLIDHVRTSIHYKLPVRQDANSNFKWGFYLLDPKSLLYKTTFDRLVFFRHSRRESQVGITVHVVKLCYEYLCLSEQDRNRLTDKLYEIYISYKISGRKDFIGARSLFTLVMNKVGYKSYNELKALQYTRLHQGYF